MVELKITKKQFVTLVNLIIAEKRSAEWNVKDKDKDKLASSEDRDRLADANDLLNTVLSDGE